MNFIYKILDDEKNLNNEIFKEYFCTVILHFQQKIYIKPIKPKINKS